MERPDKVFVPTGLLRRLRLLAMTCLFGATAASAAQVIAVGSNRKNIAISHEGPTKWRIEDRVCVVQDSTDVVCGLVIKVTGKGAILKLDTLYEGVVIGDLVRRAGGKRMPAAEVMDAYDEQGRLKPARFNIGAGLGVGANYFFPDINFQVAVARQIAIGILPLYFKSGDTDSSVSALGAFLTANYYGKNYLQGFWIQGGVGYLNFSATATGVSESAGSPAGLLTFGYRFRLDTSSKLNVGIGGGAEYISPPVFTVVGNIKSSGLQPLISVDLSFNF